MSRHRGALRFYLLNITRDLVMRGVVRHREGQLLDDVVRAEAATVIRELSEDLTAIFGEFGWGVAGVLENLLQRGANFGAQMLADILLRKK